MNNDNILEATEEIKKAVKLIKAGKNVFIHGKSGTGKSTFIRYIRQNLSKQGKNVVVVSPTAIAAVNIKGQTIHSFFRLNPEDIYEKVNYKNKKELAQKWGNIDVFIFDEISMVRADVFDRVNNRLQEILNSNLPFAGKQIIVVGDLYQLPPVYNEKSELKQDLIFSEKYEYPYVFGAWCFNQLNFEHIIFTKVFRQKDLTFVKHLAALQDKSENSVQEALDFFNSRVSDNRPKDSVCLCAKRIDARIINEEELNKIDGEEIQIYAYHSNINPHDWKESNCPASHCLKLKIGAKVMITKNDDSPSKRYINGTIGYVSEFIKTSNDDIESIIITTAEGGNITLRRNTWYKIKLDKFGKQIEDETRFFSQFPLQLAWATTIHKAQGMTFDSTYVDLGENGAFSVGQTYVALSRVRDINGLFLKQEIHRQDIIQDKNVDAFFSTIGYLPGANFIG